jgi:hypothetical protein
MIFMRKLSRLLHLGKKGGKKRLSIKSSENEG